ncbi:MAG: hydrogenase iron-sulfur subunit [Methanocellales archaeon]|nr:hydrogenase iron-sulfur subunit [Methanocellales archaeon]MDD3291464.1 hydrogenase iron-sulfur subunit [Methanocellales archaeon]MDD5234646.1 hydrogenase iron-sulfur subunit [Methanocellales archaeon]MDD5485001.1 hydrogenase iron-sulfur subunit [Methanocellales archaeon]
MKEFDPKIVAFCCNWCSYAGADLAGVSRMQYPPNVRIIKVMCSGRIDPLFVLMSFLEGADAVLITGCHIGDCHYIDANHKTKNRFEFLKEMMAELGIEKERLRLEWISATEGEKFADMVKETVETIKKMGPSPLRPKVMQ